MRAVLFSTRRADDADVIRARLRALLEEGAARPGWLPDDDLPDRGSSGAADGPSEGLLDEADTWSVALPEHAAATATTEPVQDGPPTRSTRPGPPSGRHRAVGPATRVSAGRRGALALWVAAATAAAVVAGWSWLGRPAVQPVVDDATTAQAVPAGSTAAATSGPTTTGTAAQVVVDVVGQVATPGLVTLPAGARVADALAAAGGVLPGTDPAGINAAAVLSDGQQVAVGVPGAAPSGAASTSGGGPATGLVDLNTATLADLDALPGIGPVLAQRIVDHRAEQGPFASVEQLDDVSGIGPALFADLEPLVTV